MLQSIESQNTHFKLSIFLNGALHAIMCKNTPDPGRPQITILHMLIACWVPKATSTPLKYVIILAFPLQQ